VIEVVVIDTPSLGDRSYLVTDGTAALVVDPQRDIDRILVAAADRGVAVTHVFETHIHHDYVSGGLALAGETGATYHVNGADDVAFARAALSDGDMIEAGAMRVRVIATPGHTWTHLAYVVTDARTGDVVGVFTGGSLLHGSTGRPDLLGARHAPMLAAAQHASACRLAALLPGCTPVYPTHGPGSFCVAGPTAGGPAPSSTIAAEVRTNPVLTMAGDRYVATLLAGLDVFPAYYTRMGQANAFGADAPALLLPPPRVLPGQVPGRVAAGDWVVDLRGRRAFAAGHVPGSVSFPLGDAFAAHLGWLLPEGARLTLLASTPCQIAAAQRELARIGVDRIAGAAIGTLADWLGGEDPAYCPVSDFRGLAAARGRGCVTIVDVRRPLEWAAGHIDGAVHIPLHELPARLGELPARPVTPVWVHCRGGYRASVAASLLAAAGHQVTIVDDDFGRAAAAGLPVTSEVIVSAAPPGGRAAAAVRPLRAAG
jgi:glyoxylase-like metal-dependent hydrolase (beta-lactamase superfamily II)/rhodanese-related sulfurtransferase